MDSKYIKNMIPKKQGKDDPHISGVAGTIFGIFMVIAALGAVLMDSRVPEVWTGLFVAVMVLVLSLIHI